MLKNDDILKKYHKTIQRSIGGEGPSLHAFSIIDNTAELHLSQITLFEYLVSQSAGNIIDDYQCHLVLFDYFSD